MVSKHLNSLKCVICSYKPLYPTNLNLVAYFVHYDGDDNATIVALNRLRKEIPDSYYALGMLVGPSLAIANTGATSFLKQATSCEHHHPQATRWLQNQVNAHILHHYTRAAEFTHRTYHA